MRKLAFAVALASTALATPAVARDHSFYAGLEGGAMWIEDVDFSYVDTAGRNIGPAALTTRHKTGFDVDAIAGYDFGMIRLEGELGYKRAGVHEMLVDPMLSGGNAGDTFPSGGRSRSLSAMLNVLLDVGNEDGLSGYLGAGIGIADVKMSAAASTRLGVIGFSDSHSGLAWQGIMGVRYAVTPNVDVGVKYRYFNDTTLRFGGT